MRVISFFARFVNTLEMVEKVDVRLHVNASGDYVVFLETLLFDDVFEASFDVEF